LSGGGLFSFGHESKPAGEGDSPLFAAPATAAKLAAMFRKKGTVPRSLSMKFFQWLLANRDAIMAIVAELEKMFGGAPVPAARISALDLREGMEAAAAAQSIDLSGIEAFIAAIEKWLPVLEAIFGAGVGQAFQPDKSDV
jgi:hypothetical protein